MNNRGVLLFKLFLDRGAITERNKTLTEQVKTLVRKIVIICFIVLLSPYFLKVCFCFQGSRRQAA